MPLRYRFRSQFLVKPDRWLIPVQNSPFNDITAPVQSNLTEVASDDDSGGYLSSAVQFNAVQGTAYRIAVDGAAAAGGEIVLTWNLEVTSDTLPVIVCFHASRDPRRWQQRA